MSNLGEDHCTGQPTFQPPSQQSTQPELPKFNLPKKTHTQDDRLMKKFVLRVQAYSALRYMWEHWDEIGDIRVWHVLLVILGMRQWASTITINSNLRLGQHSKIALSDVVSTLKFVQNHEESIKTHFFAFLASNNVKSKKSDYATNGMIYNVCGDHDSVCYLLSYKGDGDR